MNCERNAEQRKHTRDKRTPSAENWWEDEGLTEGEEEEDDDEEEDEPSVVPSHELQNDSPADLMEGGPSENPNRTPSDRALV